MDELSGEIEHRLLFWLCSYSIWTPR